MSEQPHVPDDLSALKARMHALRTQRESIVSSNYDVSDVCNLSCEGCLYFSGLSYSPTRRAASPGAWATFFKEEAARGVNFGYFAGAEPSLVPEVLRAAAHHVTKGVVNTNGIKRVPKDIRYRIHVSLWGDETASRSLRGADNGRKALANYRDDERAIAVLTVNRRNIENIVPVSQLCADNNVPITFSYFSPTDDYLARLSGRDLEESSYFRVSTAGDDLLLGADDFKRAHEAIAAAMQRTPNHVLYSLDYDKWVTQAGGLYRLGLDGVATDCGNRLARHHRHFNPDLTRNLGKCCSPNIECRDCRAYAQGYATLLSRYRQLAKTSAGFKMWLDVWELWGKIFLLPEPSAIQA